MAEALRQEFPASSDIRALGGDVALAAGEAQDALTLYREASRVRRPWPLTRKAVQAYRMLGDDAAAYALLARHAASEPNNADALMSLARESAARSDWLRTALLLDRAIALGAGNDPALLRLRAEAAAKLDRMDEARRFSARAKTLDPPPFVPR
jgi:tetratricopeptide (TPR) repeat protein